MAVNKIALGVNLRKNENSSSRSYGNYYPEVDRLPTLSMRGFVEHMKDHGCTYGRDVLEGVLTKFTECLPELVAQGVPVQLGSLGIFYPSIESVKGGLTEAQIKGANPNDVVKAVHIRFLPDQTQLDNLAGPAFKDHCSLEFRNIVKSTVVTVEGKEKRLISLTPIESFGVTPDGDGD